MGAKPKLGPSSRRQDFSGRRRQGTAAGPGGATSGSSRFKNGSSPASRLGRNSRGNDRGSMHIAAPGPAPPVTHGRIAAPGPGRGRGRPRGESSLGLKLVFMSEATETCPSGQDPEGRPGKMLREAGKRETDRRNDYGDGDGVKGEMAASRPGLQTRNPDPGSRPGSRTFVSRQVRRLRNSASAETVTAKTRNA